MATKQRIAGDGEPIAAYKNVLKTYIDLRPSGMRLRIADALGKHKSFVSQMVSPSYLMPIPARHLKTIFEICHFSAEERETFLAAYRKAHPERKQSLRVMPEPARQGHKTLRIEIPILSDANKQRRLEDAIRQLAQRLAQLATR